MGGLMAEVIARPHGDSTVIVVPDASGNEHRFIFPNHMRDLSLADMIKQATDKVRAKTNG